MKGNGRASERASKRNGRSCQQRHDCQIVRRHALTRDALLLAGPFSFCFFSSIRHVKYLIRSETSSSHHFPRRSRAAASWNPRFLGRDTSPFPSQRPSCSLLLAHRDKRTATIATGKQEGRQAGRHTHGPNVLTNERTNDRPYERITGRTDVRTNELIDRRTNGQTNKRTRSLAGCRVSLATARGSLVNQLLDFA